MDEKKDFTITLISNGSEYFYPNNTLTSFTNQLPDDIYLSEDKNWYATLQNIGVHLNYENLGISKDEPLLKAFNGHEFDRKFIELKKSDPLSSPETIASNVISKSSTESLIHVDELKIRPQYFTLDLLEKSIRAFIAKSSFLKHRLYLKFGSTQFKVSLDASGFNVDGLREYILQNPSVNRVKIYRVFFKNRMNEKIGFCFDKLIYSALKFPDDKISYSLIANGRSYNVVFLSKNQYLTSDFIIEKEFPRLASNICHVHCNAINPYNYNHNHCQIIRTVSLPRTNEYYFTEVENPIYFKLRHHELKSISVQLTNSMFEQLTLIPGVPSTIKLNIKTMKSSVISNLRYQVAQRSFLRLITQIVISGSKHLQT